MLECEKCEACIARKNDYQALREKVAKKCAGLNYAPILPEHINCDGCRMDGVKTYYCSDLCEIHKCAKGRGFEICPKVAMIWRNNAQAKTTLLG
ncbi:MAG: DUF3795 domain-containing protein [Bacteroidales bacterium]|nr:DUF3795 domain-containing protein [Bacteroidales bacterium]